jgi:ADP-ribose pyrophosphatase YjhB (NUDIX family)
MKDADAAQKNADGKHARGLDTGPYPHVVVAGLLLNRDDQTVVLKRGANVRSQPGYWSLPSGLAEHGVKLEAQLLQEFKEELGLDLTCRPTDISLLGTYENQPPDGYHWVMLVYMVRAHFTHGEVTNAEPHKHDEVRVLHLTELLTEGVNFDDTLLNFIRNAAPKICELYCPAWRVRTVDDTLALEGAQFLVNARASVTTTVLSVDGIRVERVNVGLMTYYNVNMFHVMPRVELVVEVLRTFTPTVVVVSSFGVLGAADRQAYADQLNFALANL